jgi:hypothetical protein
MWPYKRMFSYRLAWALLFKVNYVCPVSAVKTIDWLISVNGIYNLEGQRTDNTTPCEHWLYYGGIALGHINLQSQMEVSG